MPIYKVKLWHTTYTTHEVTAKDEEEAVYKSAISSLSEAQQKQVHDNLEAMEFNNEVELSDNQYTDQQELFDRENDHEQ